jgi:hypothetical protein
MKPNKVEDATGLVYKGNDFVHLLRQSQEQSQILLAQSLRQATYNKLLLLFMLVMMGLIAVAVFFAFDKFYHSTKTENDDYQNQLALQEKNLQQQISKFKNEVLEQQREKLIAMQEEEKKRYQELLRLSLQTEESYKNLQKQYDAKLLTVEKEKLQLQNQIQEQANTLKNAQVELMKTTELLRKNLQQTKDLEQKIIDKDKQIELLKRKLAATLTPEEFAKLTKETIRDD